MGAVNSALVKIFDVLFLPFARLNPWWGMIFISLLTGLFMLFIFKRFSNQKAIRLTKDRIKAHLLEFRLYKDSPSATGRAFGLVLLQNLRYLSLTLKPLLVMIIPLVLILAQLNVRFGFKPLEPGEAVLLKVGTAEGVNLLQADITVEPGARCAVETPPLRIEEERQVDWRLRAVSPGGGEAIIRLGGETFSKSIRVGSSRLKPLSPRRPGRSFFDALLNPGEKPLPRGSILASIEIAYPQQRLSLFGLPLHWLLAFFVLSLAFGLGLKGIFKIEI
ncbi:MAG: hypothetical protein A2Y56_03040 [Candidatus Aminicenantes bacterium RBG_13_63_10]|nr:MAG: hypothetical protein A2Y56_03040 [Candidatus Aminicenantes bacterium RBG_13_63_10]